MRDSRGYSSAARPHLARRPWWTRLGRRWRRWMRRSPPARGERRRCRKRPTQRSEGLGARSRWWPGRGARVTWGKGALDIRTQAPPPPPSSCALWRRALASRPGYDVLVVGGGATGAGLTRDLAMRGLRCLLVEQSDLAHGTTGHFHGLLHSGARYAVRDAEAADECIVENRIVRRIAAPHVEDTGGLFCWLEGDPDDYPGQLVAGCQKAGIEIEEISVAEARRREPLLTPRLGRAFAVPDATVEPWGLVADNAESAVDHGASIRRYTRLVGLGVEAGRVLWADLEDIGSGERERVEVNFLASAAGYWAGRVASLAGVKLQMAPGWGTMVVMNQRLCSR